MNSLENVKNQINNMITNPTSITYGCLGISTALLGYYTFIKSSDEKSSETDSAPLPVTDSEPEPEPEAVPKQRPLSENEEPQQSHETDEISYLDSTLVAENTDLKVYIVKTHFRKMKNFM